MPHKHTLGIDPHTFERAVEMTAQNRCPRELFDFPHDPERATHDDPDAIHIVHALRRAVEERTRATEKLLEAFPGSEFVAI